MRRTTTTDLFPAARRGYDPAAVEAHLEALAAENGTTLDEAAARIAALENEVAEARKHEEAVHLTILAATRTKEGMLEVAQEQADALKAQGRKDGDRIITDARMQAFQLLTEARTEAGDIVAEARVEAASLARAAEESAPRVDTVSERELTLQRRIDEMQAIIRAMETELKEQYERTATTAEPEPFATSNSRDSRFQAVPATKIPLNVAASPRSLDLEPTGAPSVEAEPKTALEIRIEAKTEAATQAATGDEAPAEPEAEMAESGDRIEIVVAESALDEIAVESASRTRDESNRFANDGTPDMAPVADEDSEDDRSSATRRSFYSRRSAKLPRIGDEAGRGTMAAMAGLRSSFTGSTEPAEPETKLNAV